MFVHSQHANSTGRNYTQSHARVLSVPFEVRKTYCNANGHEERRSTGSRGTRRLVVVVRMEHRGLLYERRLDTSDTALQRTLVRRIIHPADMATCCLRLGSQLSRSHRHAFVRAARSLARGTPLALCKPSQRASMLMPHRTCCATCALARLDRAPFTCCLCLRVLLMRENLRVGARML